MRSIDDGDLGKKFDNPKTREQAQEDGYLTSYIKTS